MTKTIYNGNLTGSTDAVRMPAIRYQNGMIKAHIGNTGNVYIGSSSDVIVGGTTDTNTTGGWPLDAGNVYVLGAPGDLSELWYICDSTADCLAYVVESF